MLLGVSVEGGLGVSEELLPHALPVRVPLTPAGLEAAEARIVGAYQRMFEERREDGRGMDDSDEKADLACLGVLDQNSGEMTLDALVRGLEADMPVILILRDGHPCRVFGPFPPPQSLDDFRALFTGGGEV